MQITDVLWDYFQATGQIGSYLMMKEIAHIPEDMQNEQGEAVHGKRLSFDSSHHFEKPRL